MDINLLKQEVMKEQKCPNCLVKMDLFNYLFSLQHGVCSVCHKDISEDHVMGDVNDQRKEALEAQKGLDEE